MANVKEFENVTIENPDETESDQDDMNDYWISMCVRGFARYLLSCKLIVLSLWLNGKVNSYIHRLINDYKILTLRYIVKCPNEVCNVMFVNFKYR